MDTVLVIPCYNEANRLPFDQLQLLLAEPAINVLFVNDGSRDRTAQVISEFIRGQPKMRLLDLSPNRGKAEAVRRGMLAGLAEGAQVVGYADADLATPVLEILRIRTELLERDVEVAMGSRVALLGTQIERYSSRHYSGRVFATLASLVLKLPVYDTQCGAKMFRNNSVLHAALAEPFSSRWAFDVELIGRLLGDRGAARLRPADFLEVPLRRWTDIPGSKLDLLSKVRTVLELLVIARRLRRRNRP